MQATRTSINDEKIVWYYFGTKKSCERYGTGENDNLSIHKSIDKCTIWSQKYKEPCEIEKIIKDLSEQELQDEKVVKVILKKCFENKEDIGSMAEGMCLEMLTEKVMELVRDLYL